MKLRRVTTAVALGIVLSSCSDGTGPEGATVRIVAGSGVTDTIDARPAQALVVEVRDAGGQLVSGHVVRYESVPISPTQTGVRCVGGTSGRHVF
jgi:hypothetical protein